MVVLTVSSPTKLTSPLGDPATKQSVKMMMKIMRFHLPAGDVDDGGDDDDDDEVPPASRRAVSPKRKS